VVASREWTAAALVASGAVVHGVDHVGHGRSAGERALVRDVEDVVTDLLLALDEMPEAPLDTTTLARDPEGSRPGIEHPRGDVFEQRLYDGARHEVFHESNRDEVLADVTGFLRRAVGA
jgi:alpha-beta hydrolase superfamily lysophospholipase